MSILINRLNVRTSSISDDVRVKDLHVVTPSDVAAALSFSRMPDISYDLIRAKYLNEHTLAQIESLADRLIEKHYADAIGNKLMKACAVVAIVEFCKVPVGYKPSIRNRAVIVGVAKTTYCRMKLDDCVNKFCLLIQDYYAVGRAKMGKQFASLKNNF